MQHGRCRHTMHVVVAVAVIVLCVVVVAAVTPCVVLWSQLSCCVVLQSSFVVLHGAAAVVIIITSSCPCGCTHIITIAIAIVPLSSWLVVAPW